MILYYIIEREFGRMGIKGTREEFEKKKVFAKDSSI